MKAIRSLLQKQEQVMFKKVQNNIIEENNIEVEVGNATAGKCWN